MKHKLRKEFIEKRKNLLESDFQEGNISAQFLQSFEAKPNAKIASYYSINSEVGTSYLNSVLLDSGYQIFLPCADYEFRQWSIDSEMAEGKFPEPKDGEEIKTSELDLIIVPLVAFDKDKNRLGYGSGYYDRILEQVNCTKIGLAFEVQKAKSLPTEEHDIKLDMIITESNIYK